VRRGSVRDLRLRFFHHFRLNFSNELLNETEPSSMGVVAVYLVRSEVIMRELEAGVGIGRLMPDLLLKSSPFRGYIKGIRPNPA